MSDQPMLRSNPHGPQSDRLADRGRRNAAFLRALTIATTSCVLVALGVATGRSATSAGTARHDDLSSPPPVLADADDDRSSPIVELPAQATMEPALTPMTEPDASAHGAAEGVHRTYDGRPVRRVRTIRMRVTAYSPDERSCGASADGITASGYSVFTNGGCLVAADPRILPLGSILSVPGYDGGGCVPVLDVGGAIKGNRLDVLFPTHEQAMAWGVRELDVEVLDFDDGKPNGFRKLRRPR